VRRILPWLISIAALVYVFGFATDWPRILAATKQANLPLFLAVTVLDKIAFFLAWAWLQAESLRRFVGPVPLRSVVALRGGSELVRAVNHGFGDAAYFLGLMRLLPGRLAVVIAAAFVPFLCHTLVLVGQITIALPFLEGGYERNRDAFVAAGAGWLIVIAIGLAVRVGPRLGYFGASTIAQRLEQVDLRRMRPILGWFVVLGAADVVFQRVTAASFGAEIPWMAMVARIPLLYAAISLPSLGNLGTRELAWAWCFQEFAPRDTLVAYALATNATFLVLNVAIGIVFLPRALELVSEVRKAKDEGAAVQTPLLSDPADP
jgi:hypothetical protein